MRPPACYNKRKNASGEGFALFQELILVCIREALIAFPWRLTAALAAGLGCPFRLITGIDCPTCGTTHALFALLCGDVRGYLSWQPFALPLAAAVWALFHCRIKPVTFLAAGIFVLNFIFWIVRLI